MNLQRLKHDLWKLSYVYPFAIDDDYKFIIIDGFNTPPGYNLDIIPILLRLPENYPESPPGLGNASVYVPSKLRFQGRKPNDFHDNVGPSEKWAWWCYEDIDWDPCRDNFVVFFEILRAHMTNPK